MTILSQDYPDLWKRILAGFSLRGTPLASAHQLSTPLAVAAGGIPTVNFDLDDITFTAGMAKRAGSVFAGAPIVQGKVDRSGTCDSLTATRGSNISGNFYTTHDPYQGTISFWFTPEANFNDGKTTYIYAGGAELRVWKTAGGLLYITTISTPILSVGVGSFFAGEKHHVVIRWDSKNKIDGTNYASISIDDTHYYGSSTVPLTGYSGANSIGHIGNSYPSNAIIEGLTVYRRVLFDGTYGKDVGNGDEIAQIYNAGAGKDPCLVTGSWDVVFCLPTNSTVGALVTGTGEAWSHPHESELLTDWYYGNKFYNNAWSVAFNGSTTVINCGKTNGLDDLHDNEFTVEAWIKTSSTATQYIINKNSSSSNGWLFRVLSSYGLDVEIQCATTGARSRTTSDKLAYLTDGKWHHVVSYYNNTGDRKIYLAIDGVWVSSYSLQTAGVGAIASDALGNLIIGTRAYSVSSYLVGNVGWTRISNNDRYSHGTNFVPSLTPPAPDANTIAQWNMSEGTGATVDNAEGTASRDGTITAGTWTPEWVATGNPLLPNSLAFNGTSTKVDCGSDAGLDDLADNEFTAEAWVRIPPGTTSARAIIGKRNNVAETGWSIQFSSGLLALYVDCVTTDAVVYSPLTSDGKWHHVVMYFNDAGDRKPYLAIDGVWSPSGTYGQTAGVGAIVSDAANNLMIGSLHSGGSYFFSGNMGWMRISNNDRHSHGVNFTPPPRSLPPAIDGNTLAQWNMSEGYGTTVDNAEGTASRDGTITAGTWVNPATGAGSMEVDNGGQRDYQWGLSFTAQADLDGIKQTWTGRTAGSDYVLRCVAHSSDANPITVQVYDETNAALIKDFDFGGGSTVTAPGVALFSFELPTLDRGAASDCTSFSVKVMGTAAGQVVYVHQCELLANLIDNPSLDTGNALANPYIPDSFSNSGIDAGDTSQESVIIHSSGKSLKYNSGAITNERLYDGSNIVVGKYYSVGGWIYGDGKSAFIGDYGLARQIRQSSLLSDKSDSSSSASWAHKAVVLRALLTSARLCGEPADSSGGVCYIDDLYAISLTDVSLTVTPASQANSLESGGIRVDGRDLCIPNPAISLPAGAGKTRARVIFRHNPANAVKYAENPVDARIISISSPSGLNYYNVKFKSANIIELSSSASGGAIVNVTYDASALLDNTEYLLELWHAGNKVYLDIDGVNRITATPGVFNENLTQLYYGSRQGERQVDIIFLAP